MTERGSIWQLIQGKQIDRKIIYVLMFALLAIPLVRPLGLPLAVSSMTRKAFDTIDGAPAGSVILMAVHISVGLWPEVEPGTLAMLKHLLGKPVRIVIVSWAADEPKLMEGALNKVADVAKANKKQYGVDFVNLGFVPGMETAMAAFAKDAHATTPTDMYGTPMSGLPMMTGIQSAKDFSLVVYITGSDVAAMIRQYVSAYTSRMVVFCTVGWVPSFMPYLEAGQLAGMVPGVSGGAQYELLIKSPGPGLATTDALSLGFLLLIVLAIVGNIIAVLERKKSAFGEGRQQ